MTAGGRRFELGSLGTFVALGLPDGMIGTAWPAMRHVFGAPVGDLGLVLLVSTAGAVTVSSAVGAGVRRLGVPLLLAMAGVAAALGATGVSLAPGFATVVGVAFLLGVASGTIDGGLNTAVGLSGRGRLLNLLHGAYGVGTALGPLVVTVAIVAGSWRAAYGALAVVDVAVSGLWWKGMGSPADEAPASPERAKAGEDPAGAPGRVDDRDPPAARGPGPGAGAAIPGPSRRAGARIAGGMALFFVYTGLEVTAGQWETSFGRQHLSLSAPAAGLATFGYWGALTAVRLLLAALPRPVPSRLVVRGGSVVAVLAAGAIWWQPGTVGTLVAFSVLGGALAGVFPALVALTPARVGHRRAGNVIAWQVGAAAAGGSAVAALAGLLVGTAGFAVLGPFLTGLAVVLAVGDPLVWRAV